MYHYARAIRRPAAGLLRLIPSFEGRPEGSVTITFELSFPRRILRYNAARAAAAGNSVTNYIYYDCRLSLSLSLTLSLPFPSPLPSPGDNVDNVVFDGLLSPEQGEREPVG